MDPQRILIVDDDPVNCEILQTILQRDQHTVVIASSGLEALRELSAAPGGMDLVLLDLRMPEMDGIETLKVIRSDYSASELPVIMVTAEGDTAVMVEALDSGVNDYLTKPIDARVLSARVRTQLSQKRAGQSLRNKQERYALAARGSNDGLWDLDRRTGELYLSTRWLEMLDYSSHEVSPTMDFWTGLMHPEDRQKFLQAIEQHCSRQLSKIEGEFRILRKDQSWRWMLVRGMAVWDAAGNAIRIAGSQTDVTETRVQDPLTNLPNRLYVRDRVASALQRIPHSPAEPCAVLILDLDRFKTINDSLGHRAGDAMLIEVARRLKCAVRPDRDVLARVVGDKFVILVGSFRAPDDLAAIAACLLRDVAQPLLLNGHRVFPRASMGIAIASPDVADADQLIDNADTAMNVAKSSGNGRFALFNPAMRQAALERLSLEDDLRAALDLGQFRLAFQPQVILESGKISAFEVLLRWMHPQRGQVLPADFIPLAESTGLMLPIGAWVLRESARQLVLWRTAFPAERELAISINVSPSQLADPDFCDLLRDILQETHAPPHHLKLELTERVFVDPKMADKLEQIRQIGVSLEMEDFGTGYCSAGDLRQTRFDSLTIDRSFVANIDSSRDSLETVSAMIMLARSLCLKVVAEGVETESQARTLRDLGCKYGQGYHFSKPVSSDCAGRLLAGQQRLRSQ